MPLRYPASPKAYHILANGTDATLLAKAMEWAALNEACYGDIFNITNGDVFRWSQVFPQIAESFGINCADPQTFSLTLMHLDSGEEIVKLMSYLKGQKIIPV
ncbi:MAG: hypothetical protein DSM106950_09785 [Stigonema ocellatum SAG 48.90 = DSM 106950]|nr:hypothetical protein [Stigonema ocellatum SAG 48.90 = DSM 106950]